jgi:hypothetical protein
VSFRIYQRVELYYASNINQKLEKYQPITGLVEFFLQLTRVGFRIYYYGLAFSSLRSTPEYVYTTTWARVIPALG